ncbi:transglycosylase domain-containing protein [Schlegelella sp. S2-27]|uniref:Transglycosylase domain-containing protein n=1 Tax=Caldimonas mangrovi TaxID=2944811 RepID=A0ABT0YSW0_9BURK|nr:biosynthetic peptidoglycan transglycosylase [Caldimonas mangrovi]MCM5681703.1 transglycosylase domain-containing protein [Caldimonas mangrovi]
MNRAKKWLIGLGVAALTFVVVAAAGLLLMLRTVAAGPDEWSTTVRLGPFERSLSVPALIRAGTHPLGMWLLDGRRLRTSAGVVQWQAYSDGQTLYGRCEPCVLKLPALGETAVSLPRAAWTIKRNGQSEFRGTLALGRDEQAVRGAWRGQLSGSALALQVHLQRAPIASYYALFGTDIPELQQARIEGEASVQLRTSLPSGAWQLRPQVEGFQVHGLGTEALVGAGAPRACAAPKGAAGWGRWLPLAVLSAEDQRFHEHGGYDLAEINAAWQRNQRDDAPTRGASTLTQQLAKLVYTGDDRTHVRKLRELLYAVEMERTLGKARILQLYLSLAPWGEGRCGGEAPAQRYLGKPAAELTPIEASWLASLLRSPDAQVRHWRRTGEIDRKRVALVLDGLRPVPPAVRRIQLQRLPQWQPAWRPASGASIEP